jgi:hypothetical protein
MVYGGSAERLAQYAALGRFVVAFEDMVAAARTGAQRMLTAGNSPLHQRLVNIALHHSALSAVPLMEIFRSLCAEMLQDAAYGWKPADIEPLSSALKQAAKDYGNLASKRNIIVHGTWFFIGSEPGPYDMFVEKYKATAGGFSAEDGPNSSEELLALARECGEVARLLTAIDLAMSGPISSSQAIKKVGGRWATALAGSDAFSDILPYRAQFS